MQALFSNMDQALSSNRPTAKSVIDNLPTVDNVTVDPESTCPICMDNFNDNDKVVTQLECKHFYHLECIKPWLAEHNTCPTCRLEMKTEEVAEDSNPFRPRTQSAGAAARTTGVPTTEPPTNGREEAGLPSRGFSFSRLFPRREQSRAALTAISAAPTPRSSARLSSSSSSRDTSTSSPTRRQPSRGVKRSSRQQSQAQAQASVAEASMAEAVPSPTSRRTRRRLNPPSSSASSPSQPLRVPASRSGLNMFSYVAGTQAGQTGMNNGPTSTTSNGDSSTPASVPGGNRASSRFPFFTSGPRFRVQQLLPLPELTDTDMESPIRALLASVSASTRAGNTEVLTSSSSSQTESRTSSHSLHYTRISSRPSEGREGEPPSNSPTSFVPSFVQRLQSSLQGTATQGTATEEGPYRRRANVQVRMRRFRVGRARNTPAENAPNSQPDSPPLAPE